MSWAESLNASGAIFSPCRRWRYLLWRRWDTEKGVCVFIGLNPSTADERVDDPTIRRCVRFAKDWGYGSVYMVNAFAFRATDPKVMLAAGQNAIGPQNNTWLLEAGQVADLVIACWGADGHHLARDDEIRRMYAGARLNLYALGFTKRGLPRHPLYLKASTQPALWPIPAPVAT
jgi:hypothetical protein